MRNYPWLAVEDSKRIDVASALQPESASKTVISAAAKEANMTRRPIGIKTAAGDQNRLGTRTETASSEQCVATRQKQKTLYRNLVEIRRRLRAVQTD
jgi:hypothetical protein